jgi:recombination protein RecA
MKEEDRQRAIRVRLARMENRPVDQAIATGFAALDSALGGGGFPRGRIVEVFGPSSSGKTTLALQVIARLQKKDGAAGWIDAEHSFDPAYAASLGVDIEHLPVAQPDSAEQGLEIARQLAFSGAVDLLVIDSAAALVPKLELEAGIGDSGPGLQGRVLASGLRSLSSAAARTGTSLIFLNQVRSRMESSGGEAETSAGGAPLKLFAAVRISLGPGAGRRVRFRVLKNKSAAAFGEGELEWNQGRGFVETP